MLSPFLTLAKYIGYTVKVLIYAGGKVAFSRVKTDRRGY